MANTLKFGNGQWATKEGSTLAYNSENNNYKPLPFNFERDSVATRVNKQGLIETVGANEPRVDYKDNTDGALLLEPSRTNLITYSEDFSQSAWNKTNLTLLSNNIISPDGTSNASKLTVTSTGAVLETTQSLSVGTVYTISAFVKKGTNKFVRLAYSSSGQTGAWFNLEDKTVGTVNSISATINDYGNGWYKITNTLTSQVASGGVFLGLSNTDGATGDSISGNTVFVWGFQVEQGSYPTSLINTNGSAVTRLNELSFERDDLVSKNLIGSTEFTWFYDSILFYRESGSGVSPRLENLSNGNIFVGINVPQIGNTNLTIRHKDGSTAANTSGVTFTNGGRYKIAVKISGTTGNAYINGTNVGTFTTADAIDYNKYRNAANNPNNIIDMRFYNTALSDSELIALTQV